MVKYTPEFHKKGWGYELWITNSASYCGKLLFFSKGKKCSFHYHKLKKEHFYIQSGKIKVIFSYEDSLEEAKTVILQKNDVFFVPQGMRHQMVALEDTELFEFSTEHFEDDSYRIVKGD